jgi:hypothetical protein
MNKNTKIAIGLVALAGLLFAYKKGLFTKKVSETGEPVSNGTSETGLPIVNLTASSETPQVVETKLPAQFTETVTASVPSIPGSYQSYQS